VPGTAPGNDWYIDWRAPTNRIQVPDLLKKGGPFDHDFYRCLWYWYEIEARIALDLAPALPPDALIPLNWKGVIEGEAVLAMLDRLDRPHDRTAVMDMCTRPMNRLRRRKERHGVPAIPWDEAQAMASEFRAALEQRADPARIVRHVHHSPGTVD